MALARNHSGCFYGKEGRFVRAGGCCDLAYLLRDHVDKEVTKAVALARNHSGCFYCNEGRFVSAGGCCDLAYLLREHIDKEVTKAVALARNHSGCVSSFERGFARQVGLADCFLVHGSTNAERLHTKTTLFVCKM